MRKIIGISGKAGVGKDTVATCIKTKYPDRYIHMALAEPIKSIGKIFGFTDDQLYNQQLKEEIDSFWGISPRHFLQRIGTELFRDMFDKDVWVKVVQKKITQTPEDSVIVIPDVRFPNECHSIHEMGGECWKIVSNIYGKDLKGETSAHSSEKGLPDAYMDRIIENNYKTRVTLCAEILKII